jgi:hypothetical protein
MICLNHARKLPTLGKVAHPNLPYTMLHLLATSLPPPPP